MKINNFDIERINNEIEKGDFKIAEELINEEYENRGFSSEIMVPDKFVFKTAQRAKDKRKKNITKVLKIASVFICASVLSITAYAATQYFRGVEHFGFGFIIGREDSEEVKDESFDTSEIRKQMDNEKNMEHSVISEEQQKNNEKWISQKIYNEKSVYHYSDDGINWDKSDTEETRIVEYVYSTYEQACEDKKLPVLFQSNKEKEVFFYEYDAGGDGKIDDSELKVKYILEHGKFTMDLYKNFGGNSDIKQIIITDTNGTVDQRKIMVDEFEWLLSDSQKNGNVITTTVQSIGSYFLVLQFENIQDQEIGKILKKIHLNALIE